MRDKAFAQHNRFMEPQDAQERNHLCVLPVARNSLNLVIPQSTTALTCAEIATSGPRGLTVRKYT